tara:strand:- start:186 stop:497 length:312 start_codon:yes stop_codon:yes gene_type:complete
MAKAKQSILTRIGYSDWSVRRTIDEAENIARWRPWLAHEWMEEAAARLDIVYAPHHDYYDAAVKRINAYWKRHRQYRWFNEREFWKDGKTYTSPKMLDTLYDF